MVNKKNITIYILQSCAFCAVFVNDMYNPFFELPNFSQQAKNYVRSRKKKPFRKMSCFAKSSLRERCNTEQKGTKPKAAGSTIVFFL